MSIQLQRQIKQNAEDIREYIDDLFAWEAEMAKKDKSTPSSNKVKSTCRIFLDDLTRQSENTSRAEGGISYQRTTKREVCRG